jgi:dCMP deaminase
MKHLKNVKEYLMFQINKDLYFLRIAREVSKASKCLSRKIGSVLVKNECIVSEGRNGPPRGTKHCNERKIIFYSNLDKDYNNPLCMKDGKSRFNSYFKSCPRKEKCYKSGQGLHLCCAQHSEENVINQAARNGISTLGTTIYCYCCLPCKNCMGSIINAGIKEVVCLKVRPDYDIYSRILAEEAKIQIREIEEKLV